MKRNNEIAESARRIMQNMTANEYNQLSQGQQFAERNRWYKELRELYPDKSINTIRSAIAYQLRKGA